MLFRQDPLLREQFRHVIGRRAHFQAKSFKKSNECEHQRVVLAVVFVGEEVRGKRPEREPVGKIHEKRRGAEKAPFEVLPQRNEIDDPVPAHVADDPPQLAHSDGAVHGASLGERRPVCMPDHAEAVDLKPLRGERLRDVNGVTAPTGDHANFLFHLKCGDDASSVVP